MFGKIFFAFLFTIWEKNAHNKTLNQNKQENLLKKRFFSFPFFNKPPKNETIKHHNNKSINKFVPVHSRLIHPGC